MKNPKFTPKAEQVGGLFQVRNLKSQLSFIISENDSLRKEVKSLNRSISAYNNELSTNNSSSVYISEIEALRKEIQNTKEERDTALKEVLLLK